MGESSFVWGIQTPFTMVGAWGKGSIYESALGIKSKQIIQFYGLPPTLAQIVRLIPQGQPPTGRTIDATNRAWRVYYIDIKPPLEIEHKQKET
jgi:hypothetical protein